MQNIIEVIQKRTSVRTYSKQPIEQNQRAALEAYLKTAAENPFGAHVRLAVVDSADAPERLGTYGFIRGAQTYVAGCVKKGGRDLEGFGFAFEQAVLFATQMGLGTCWLGGTLRRGAFGKALALADDEMLPAVSPVGYAAQRRSLTERIVASSAGARKRMDFDALFFDSNYGTPMATKDERFRTCLEMVRIGPSASNKQPWRVIRADGNYHFYMAKSPGYAGNAMGFAIQRIDMGIAACHFMLTAHEMGLDGHIFYDDPKLLTPEQEKKGIDYRFSWGQG
jgi:nitroreductase